MSAVPANAVSAAAHPAQVSRPAQAGRTPAPRRPRQATHAATPPKTAQTGHAATGTAPTRRAPAQVQHGAGTPAAHASPPPAPIDTTPPRSAAETQPKVSPDTTAAVGPTDSSSVVQGDSARQWVLYGSLAVLALVLVIAAVRLLRPRRRGGGNTDAKRAVREYRESVERAAGRDGWGSSGAALPAAARERDGRDGPAGASADPQISAAIAQIDSRLDALVKATETARERVDGRLETIQQQLEVLVEIHRGGGGGGRLETHVPLAAGAPTRFAAHPHLPVSAGLHTRAAADAHAGPGDDGRLDARTIEWTESARDLVVSHAVGGYGASSLAGGGAPAENRVPVEINGGEVAVTHTIPPDAWLVPQGGGRASVWLNGEVEHNRYALERFALFFDLGDRREGEYQTRTPADVEWDEGAQRGTLRSPGKAVAR